LFDRFGSEIAYDFRAELGIDVIDYFTGERSFVEFHAFLHELPTHRKFKSALVLDEEYAGYVYTEREKARMALEEEMEELEDSGEEVDPWRRPALRSQEDYTPELAALHILDEHIQALIKTVIGLVTGKSGPDVQKHPRPYTMIDAIGLEAERDDMHDFARRVGLRKDKPPA